jgi:membrane protein DedA with SNARE-associated domain
MPFFATGAAEDLGGIVGVAARLIEALGEWGVGLLVVIETVFPPIPSEIVLTLAGFLVRQGEMNAALVLVTATAGSLVGAFLLYWLGAALGRERSIRLLGRLPLVDEEDFQKGADWFDRHGRPAVFFSRLLPGLRSVISLPAGAARMNLLQFGIFTGAGSLLWNGLLIFLGWLLGSQYELVDRYSSVLDWLVIGAIAAVIVWLIIRRVRRRSTPH